MKLKRFNILIHLRNPGVVLPIFRTEYNRIWTRRDYTMIWFFFKIEVCFWFNEKTE
jgi:hypothetical protein